MDDGPVGLLIIESAGEAVIPTVKCLSRNDLRSSFPATFGRIEVKLNLNRKLVINCHFLFVPCFVSVRCFLFCFDKMFLVLFGLDGSRLRPFDAHAES